MTTAAEGEGPRRTHKSDAAFRTISEVAQELGVPQHVLRFWETRFPAIQPLKRGGGRRYYRPEDVALLRAIRTRLYDDGFTIKGVRKILDEKGVDGLIAPPAMTEASADAVPAADAPVGREPNLPLDLPTVQHTGLSPHQRAEVRAAIGTLVRLKNSLDQALADAEEASGQD